jgi:hypothetical protein
MADVSNEIQTYIQEIASATVASNKKTVEWSTNMSKEAKAKDDQLKAMTAQIQALTNTIATLSTAIAAAAKENTNPNNDGDGGGGGSGGGRNCGRGSGNRDDGAFCYTCNMGGYCLMHGNHPVGINHTSVRCPQKYDNHNNSATAMNCMGSCMFWLGVREYDPPSKTTKASKENLPQNDRGKGWTK